MAKKSMQIKYKSKKRERNKNKEEETEVASIMSFGKTLLGVVIFLGLMYACSFGMQKLGVFEAGYTEPTKEETTFSYEYIPVSTVFTRSEKTYFVLFDNYKDNYSSDSYVNSLLSKSKIRSYKVDMSLKENQVVKSEKSNNKATKSSELQINDITLIKISNGRIADYIVGSEKIEEFLK